MLLYHLGVILYLRTAVSIILSFFNVRSKLYLLQVWKFVSVRNYFVNLTDIIVMM